MQYWNGSKWISIPIGTNGQVLTICGGIPTWGTCPATSPLTLSPPSNPYEGFINAASPNAWEGGNATFLIAAWTSGGPITTREIVKFDYSTIPAGAIIDSARLYLYADSTPNYGNGVNPMYSEGAGNSCSISRITSPFNLPGGFTWNAPPSFSTTNQAVIPASTSFYENSAISVTNLVKDQIATNNYGFYIRLQTETIYNIRQFVSSFDANVGRRPKLIIYFH